MKTKALKQTIKDILFPFIDLKVSEGEKYYLEKINLSSDKNLYSPENNKELQKGDLFIRIYENVILWPSQSVIQKDNYFIKDSYIDEKRENTLRLRKELRKFPVVKHHGYCTSMDYVFSKANFYHQFVDSLPRLWALRHPKLSNLPITLFLTRKLDENQELIIKALLPRNVELKYVSRFSRIKADTYIHLPFLSKDRVGYNPNSTFTSAGFIPSEYLLYFKNLVFDLYGIAEKDIHPKKIFLSREFTGKRHIINEVEVQNYLKSKGFEIISPEKLSFKKQIELFRDGSQIIAQMGAALTNLLYSNNGGYLIEINSSKNLPHHFRLHCEVLDKIHLPILFDKKTIHDDILLPIEYLEEAINKLKVYEQD